MLARLLGVRIFDVEASSRCNVHCRFCPRELLPETGLMSRETFSRFLDGVGLRSTDSLSFVGLGEPLLNPELPEFISGAARRYPGVRTWVTTNGTLLSAENVRQLLDVGLDTLDVSFNGLDKATYEGLMRGADFERTLANVERAVELIRRSGGPTGLQINFIVTAENSGHEEAIRSFWRSRGVERFRVQRMHNRAGGARLAGMSPVDAPGLGGAGCALFRTMSFISWRGDVHYCSHDMARRFAIGSVLTEDWTAIETKKLALGRSGRWPGMCRSCTDPLRHDMGAKLDAEIWRAAGRNLARVFRRSPTAARVPSPLASAGRSEGLRP